MIQTVGRKWRLSSDGRERPELGSLWLVAPGPSPEILLVLGKAALEPDLGREKATAFMAAVVDVVVKTIGITVMRSAIHSETLTYGHTSS